MPLKRLAVNLTFMTGDKSWVSLASLCCEEKTRSGMGPHSHTTKKCEQHTFTWRTSTLSFRVADEACVRPARIRALFFVLYTFVISLFIAWRPLKTRF